MGSVQKVQSPEPQEHVRLVVEDRLALQQAVQTLVTVQTAQTLEALH